MSENNLASTVLNGIHKKLGGKMVPFAGYDMPIQYESILAETRAVRKSAGIFDVSHMGRFFIEGEDSQQLLNWIHTANISNDMPLFRARYGLVCNESGGIIDDAIIYKLANSKFLLVANASNSKKILNWLQFWASSKYPMVQISDKTQDLAMIAVQGPSAMKLIEHTIQIDISSLKPFTIAEASISGDSALIARTGYTGEDGVEIMPSTSTAEELWINLANNGATLCGLGARDVLRLEAGLLLHGQDMDESINPIEAGLEKFVDFNKDFCGSQNIKSPLTPVSKNLIGFKTEGRSLIPRSHSNILQDGKLIGHVTSGGFSPSLDTNIGLGYVQNRELLREKQIEIDVRGRKIYATVVELPFYKREKS